MEGIHRDHGATHLIFETQRPHLKARGGSRGRVRTGHGQLIECDFVVVGLGIEPVTELLTDTGAVMRQRSGR